MIMYTFIRQDMDLQHQLVQACHSSLEAGSNFKKTDKIPYLICLGMKNGEALRDAERFLIRKGIKYHKFYEPDNNLGFTSITTEPLDWEQKRYFSNYGLWKFKPELAPSKELKCS